MIPRRLAEDHESGGSGIVGRETSGRRRQRSMKTLADRGPDSRGAHQLGNNCSPLISVKLPASSLPSRTRSASLWIGRHLVLRQASPAQYGIVCFAYRAPGRLLR
jgi:hypothetical protein